MIPQAHNRRRYIRILYRVFVQNLQPKVVATMEGQTIDAVYHVMDRYGPSFERRKSGEFWRINILEAVHP